MGRIVSPSFVIFYFQMTNKVSSWRIVWGTLIDIFTRGNKKIKTPKVIYRGAKILHINIEEFQMDIIDSYNCIGMALSKFSPTYIML